MTDLARTLGVTGETRTLQQIHERISLPYYAERCCSCVLIYLCLLTVDIPRTKNNTNTAYHGLQTP